MPDPLRADVRLLGELLGQVLAEYGGQELLDDVERLRELTIAAHGDAGLAAVEEAEALVAGFEPVRAEEVARAFTCYFHLVNLAEEFHRVRVLRQRESAAGSDGGANGAGSAPADSLPGAIAALASEIGDEEAARRLQGLQFRPVLTAHPTEARRRAIGSGIRRISVLVAERDDPRLGGSALLENRRRLLAEIDGLWRTAQLRMTKPSPLDEVRTAMGVFDETLFQALPQVYRRLDDALQGDLAGTVKPIAPAFVRLGSWIGADRDGNPNVTARVTRAAAAIASEHVLIALERATTRIGRALTIDAATTPASSELDALWQRQRQLAEDYTADVAERSPNEPYRRVLLVAAERLGATRARNADLAYANAAEFAADLQVVQNSLLAAGAPRAAYADLQQLIWQVETFGFHLAELEVRQHSAVHASALANLAAGTPIEEMTAEVLAVFRTIATLQQRYGRLACSRYIISFTQKAGDIDAVYQLAEAALGSPEAAPVLDVIPLFETFDDLTACVDILDEVIGSTQVQRRLELTDRRMEVMLGYSDSAKDVGPVSATLAIYDAQSRIAKWAKRNDITLTLFHGRGGALGRGGGPANRAVLAQPPGSVDGRFKLTEQGEVISARYGDATIAARHIEQVAAATLLASAPSTEARNAGAAQAYADVAELMDRVSRVHYHALVKAEGFAHWFTQVTPQEEIGLLSLGSRPARRGLSVESLEDLRAIPWVFAWTQARVNLTGWFGLGTAMDAVGDVDRLKRAYAEWPLFTTMLDNVEMSLAKTDDRIARRYLELGDRDDLAAMVLDELALTTKWVLEVTGHDRLLSGRRVLGRAVELRNPYVDALSFIQLRALRALRDTAVRDGADDGAVLDVEQAQRLLLLSVNGIAAGLQNTG